MRYLFVLAVLGLSLLGCKEKKAKVLVQDSNEGHVVKVEEGIKDDPCIRCDSIFRVFPKDSLEFEKLYGYPDGSRQAEAHIDVDNYFKCLDDCYKFQRILSMVELETKIIFDADGPTYVRHYTTDYLMRNSQIAEQIYNEVSCVSFKKHIQFSFEQISRHDSFYPQLCDFLQKINVADNCKEKILESLCVHKNIETHEH